VDTKKILVIDDEADIRKLIQTCLEITGKWQVIMAASGSEGLSLAQRDRPDAIILDVMMPDIDGLTTLERLRSEPIASDIPVILLTARGRFIEQKFAELGVKSVINKPFNPLTISEQITAALSANT
jgi:CheY-like chemotaxis protein